MRLLSTTRIAHLHFNPGYIAPLAPDIILPALLRRFGHLHERTSLANLIVVHNAVKWAFPRALAKLEQALFLFTTYFSLPRGRRRGGTRENSGDGRALL